MPATQNKENDSVNESPAKKAKLADGSAKATVTDVDSDVKEAEEKKEFTQTEKLRNLRLKKIVRENHGQPITQAFFNSGKDANKDILATVAGNQVNVYDNQHCGNYLDLVTHFVNNETEYVSGETLTAGVWVNTDHDACLVFAGLEHTIQVVSIAHTKVIKLLKGHTGDIVSLASCPVKPALLASASRQEGCIRLWNLNTEECVALLHGKVNSVFFSPSGDELYIGGADGNVSVYPIDLDTIFDSRKDALVIDADSFKSQLKPRHTTAVDGIRFSVNEDGNTLVYTKSRDGVLRVWENGQLEMAFQFTPSPRDLNSTFDVSPDARYIVGGTSEGDVLIYDTLVSHAKDAVRNKPMATLQHRRCRQPVLSAMFTASMESVLFASGDALWRWDFVDPATIEDFNATSQPAKPEAAKPEEAK